MLANSSFKEPNRSKSALSTDDEVLTTDQVKTILEELRVVYEDLGNVAKEFPATRKFRPYVIYVLEDIIEDLTRKVDNCQSISRGDIKNCDAKFCRSMMAFQGDYYKRFSPSGDTIRSETDCRAFDAAVIVINKLLDRVGLAFSIPEIQAREAALVAPQTSRQEWQWEAEREVKPLRPSEVAMLQAHGRKVLAELGITPGGS